jgi:hypothetical protein
MTMKKPKLVCNIALTSAWRGMPIIELARVTAFIPVAKGQKWSDQTREAYDDHRLLILFDADERVMVVVQKPHGTEARAEALRPCPPCPPCSGCRTQAAAIAMGLLAGAVGMLLVRLLFW